MMPAKRAQRSGPDWWARGIGAFGILVAFGSLLLQWHSNTAEKARRLDVRLFFGAPIAKGKQYRAGLQIKAANPGYQPVTVTTAGVIFPSGRRFCVDRAKGTWEFGSPIPPGENKTVLLAGDDLVALCQALRGDGFQESVTLVGFYEDALNRLHKSDPFAFAIDDALELARAQAQTEGAVSDGAGGTRKSQ
jgi:hypothetical protein